MMWFITGISAGVAVALMWLALALSNGVTRDDCRAANPGYECTLGWVRGEPFGAAP